MTYTKLIERLREEAVHPSVTVQMRLIAMEAADAIEALQAECGSVTSANMKLQSENERLKAQWSEWSDSLDSVMKQRNALQAERDALAAELAELKSQEPVAKFDWNKGAFVWLTKYDYHKHHNTPLYAAPKAMAPLKDEPWMVKAINEAHGIGGTL